VRARPLIAAALAAIWVAGPAGALAQPAVQHTPAGVAWMTGGAGEDEREAMRAQAAQYNLAMTFANRRSGAFRADVAVEVRDARGEVVLAATAAGPLLFAKLPPGSYRVSATALERTQSQQASVPQAGLRELYFYWVDPTEPEPGGG
jgi:hypothetical protein